MSSAWQIMRLFIISGTKKPQSAQRTQRNYTSVISASSVVDCPYSDSLYMSFNKSKL